MGYQALLFCPDEKTARTVTQVLSELEFNVEACIEPFAAVKKLMGQHFDAVVVDCDNEQNATLLFKSARNSTPNQASLAVAVVEGQAGVAKAFRIGANLVLTKPINIEQSKGTLRVARGLLRKGDPAKPGASGAAPAASAPAMSASPVAPAATPAAKPAAPRPVPAAKPAAAPAASLSVAKTAAVGAFPAKVAPVSSDAATGNEDILVIKAEPAVPPSPTEIKPAGLLASFGSGAASAPAPARESHQSQATAIPAHHATAESGISVETPAKTAPVDSHSSAAAASFTFGGANVAEESSGSRKKIILGIAAAVVVAAGLYFGWTQFQKRTSEPVSNQKPATPAAAAPAPIAKPSSAQPLPASATLPALSATTSSAPSSQSALAAAPSSGPATDDANSASETTPSRAGSTAKPSSSTSPAASKPVASANTAPAALVVKGGSAAAAKAKAEATDIDAPTVDMGTPSDATAPANLVGDGGSAPQPVLQTLSISQGVSQGLLIKKVQPTYPRMALTMRIEGAVELMTTVSKTGDITHVKVLSGDQQLARAAVDAVKQWKYKPYLLNGEPVEIQTQVTMNFRLPK